MDPKIFESKYIPGPRGRFPRNFSSIGSAVSEVNLHTQTKSKDSYFVYLDGFIGSIRENLNFLSLNRFSRFGHTRVIVTAADNPQLF